MRMREELRVDVVLLDLLLLRLDAHGSLVTTTDPHLARRIADALHDAYKGELRYRYNKEENLLRVTWSR